jgi:arsenical pump membrane protein
MLFVIGNPTNIYLSSVSGIGFAEYVSVMWLPALLAGGTSLLFLWLLFRKSLSSEISPVVNSEKIADRGLLLIGVIHLAACVVCLAISSYAGFPMWIAAVGFAASLGVCTLVYAAIRRQMSSAIHLLGRSLRRAPWVLVPFVISMFLIVLSLEKYGVTEKIAALLNGKGMLIKYGVSSYLVANVINNIPMSVLFGGVVSVSGAPSAVYASVIGSNLGACLTPVGALAGIMWTGLLKTHGVDFSFRRFIAYGAAVSLPALAAALAGLALIL